MTKQQQRQEEIIEANIEAISTLYDLLIHQLNVPAELITEHIEKDKELFDNIFCEDVSVLVAMLHDDSIDSFALKLKEEIINGC